MCTVSKPECQVARVFPENVVRSDRKPDLVEKTLRLAVGTPLCQIVPVSRAYAAAPHPSTRFWPEGIFQGEEGGGVYTLKPPAAGILYPPLSFPPPHPYIYI